MSKIGGFASSMFAMGDGASRVGSRWYFMNVILGALFFVKKNNIEETYKKRQKEHERTQHGGQKCDCGALSLSEKHRGKILHSRMSVAASAVK